jgi:hypothetical protein
MTVRELIAELSKYPPDAELRLETQEGSTSVEKVDCYAGRVVKLFGNGWDDLPEDDDEECDECGELVEDCECDDHEPFHVESSDSFDPRSDDTDD